ncbi:MAG: hypothetical protein JSW07_00690 [bacterium]|nr:MAG: hypothetical protein JSW07_00690 [bacterium]
MFKKFKYTVTFVALFGISTLCLCCSMQKGLYLESALEVAKWLQSTSIQTNKGKVWLANPDDSTTIATNLYSGSVGVVLFFLELYQATNKSKYLTEAKSGADYLIVSLPDTITTADQAGLYTGIAGIGFALEETYRTTGSQQYRKGSLRCVQLLHRSANRVGSGVQ